MRLLDTMKSRSEADSNNVHAGILKATDKIVARFDHGMNSLNAALRNLPGSATLQKNRTTVSSPIYLQSLRAATDLTSWRHSRQAEVVQLSCGDRNLIVQLPTGSGKTICFALPSYAQLNPDNRVTVVAVPYKATLTDIVGRLSKYRIAAEQISGNAIPDPDSCCPLVIGIYDTILSAEGLTWMKKLGPRLRRLVLDEAHKFVVDSSWRVVLCRADVLSTIDCPKSIFSATLGEGVTRQLITTLGLEDYDYVSEPVLQPKIHFSVQFVESTSNTEKVATEIILPAVNLLEPGQRALVFQENIDNLTTIARIVGGSVISAQTPEHSISLLLGQFKTGLISSLECTSAFGSGTNPGMPLRYVFQIGLPPSMHDWIQFSGRGGREGEVCEARMILSHSFANGFSIPTLQDLKGVRSMADGIMDPSMCLRAIHGGFFDGERRTCTSYTSTVQWCGRCRDTTGFIEDLGEEEEEDARTAPKTPAAKRTLLQLPTPSSSRDSSHSTYRQLNRSTNPDHRNQLRGNFNNGFNNNFNNANYHNANFNNANYNNANFNNANYHHINFNNANGNNHHNANFNDDNYNSGNTYNRGNYNHGNHNRNRNFNGPYQNLQPPQNQFRPQGHLQPAPLVPAAPSLAPSLPATPIEIPGLSDVQRLEVRNSIARHEQLARRCRVFRSSVIELKKACITCYVMTRVWNPNHQMTSIHCPYKTSHADFVTHAILYNAHQPKLVWTSRRACVLCHLPWDPRIHTYPNASCHPVRDVILRVVALVWLCHREALQAFMRECGYLDYDWGDEADFRIWCTGCPSGLEKFHNVHLVFEWFVTVVAPLPTVQAQPLSVS